MITETANVDVDHLLHTCGVVHIHDIHVYTINRVHVYKYDVHTCTHVCTHIHVCMCTTYIHTYYMSCTCITNHTPAASCIARSLSKRSCNLE